MVVATPRQIRYSTPVITREMEEAIVEALRGEPYILADRTKAFERAFREFIGTSQAVAVSSGTAALHLALLAAELGDGGEIIMPANAYPPVADCIRLVGAVPVLVDVDERTGCLDPSLLEAGDHPSHARGDSTPHVWAPDRHGSADGAGAAHNLIVIEDAAHALGQPRPGADDRVHRAHGYLQHRSQAHHHWWYRGMVTTDNAEWAERIDRLRNHGRDEREQRDLREMDRVTLLGFNYRQSEVLAALGELQVQQLPTWHEERRANAARYRERLSALDGLVQPLEELPGRSTATSTSRSARSGATNWPRF